jgi:light-regulated signal transduction histidine kinase (bacteriophytochrome)/CheY-like chemotaxis protein
MQFVDLNQTVDLNSCDREPIHLSGRIQPFGAALIIDSDWHVRAASANAEAMFGCEGVIGSDLSRVIGDEAVHAIRNKMVMVSNTETVERIFALPFRPAGRPFDVAVHLSSGNIVLEAEPSLSESDVSSGELVRAMLFRLRSTSDFDMFCREGARQMRVLTGFDRVMVYRFDHDGSGEVIAEAVRGGIGSFLGQHFPPSDIPQQARELYRRNWLRIIADVNAAPSPLLPAREAAIDLSMSVLRAVSPIHIEYLQNMGVQASLSVSILRDDKLWGLFACHHMEPRLISFERRTAAELFGQMFSWLLENRERETEVSYEGRAREISDRMMASMAAGASVNDGLEAFLSELRGSIVCDGIGLWSDERVTLQGKTPTKEEFMGLVRHLNTAVPNRVFATNEIGKFYPPGAEFAERAAGFLAVPISRAARDYLVFFRQEARRAVTWGGDPTKPVHLGPHGARLTPRKSFEAWQEVVSGQSKFWQPSDLRIAEQLRIVLLEVFLQVTDIAQRERKSAQARQELLIAELNHRVRNILSLIRALVSQSRSGVKTAEQFAAVVDGRIQALARAHDLITKTNWGPGNLETLIATESAAYLRDKATRVRYSGPSILLEPQAFSTLALVMHEMITNSAKYGALADSTGGVDIESNLGPTGDLEILWREYGGPPVKPPTRRGFGTTIIERSIPFELKGESEIHYDLMGVRGRMLIPASFVRRADGNAPQAEADAERERTQHKDPIQGRALLVEDNLLVAMEGEAALRTLGLQDVDVAASTADALRIIKSNNPPTIAMLDLNLGTESSIGVAMELKKRGIPFVFATGYGERANLPDELSAIQIVQKPYTVDTLHPALRQALKS